MANPSASLIHVVHLGKEPNQAPEEYFISPLFEKHMENNKLTQKPVISSPN